MSEQKLSVNPVATTGPSGLENPHVERSYSAPEASAKPTTWNPLYWFSATKTPEPTTSANTSSSTTPAAATNPPQTFYQRWFHWYYILPGLFVFFYIMMLAESFSESRRNRKKKREEDADADADADADNKSKKPKIEQMTSLNPNLEKVKKTMRRGDNQIEAEKRKEMKIVSYKKMWHDFLSRIYEYFAIIYDLWIAPWVYWIGRAIGGGSKTRSGKRKQNM